MAVTPPPRRIWWNEPIEKVELIWITVAFIWGLVMFGVMIGWHFVGRQNLANETYRQTAKVYEAQAEAFAQKYQVREDKSGLPVVKPPAGSDVYMIARLWQWWPLLELEKGQSYRVHLMSLDWQHGFSLQPVNINIQVHPGYEQIITLTPTEAGEFGIICNEFCGIGHSTMVGRITVVDKPAK